jgi:hypothetical protein
VFTTGVVNISDKQFTSVYDTGDMLSPVSLLPMIIPGVIDTGD